MLKRAVASAIISLGLFAGNSLHVHAENFNIDVPQKVKQGEMINIGIKADGLRSVKLSVTDRQGTAEYTVPIENGLGNQQHTFSHAGSSILKATDSNNPKNFVTKSLHVQFVPGGNQ